MKQLLAAVDLSNATDCILDEAAMLAKSMESKLWILHVVSDEAQTMAYEPTQFAGFSADFIHVTGDVQLARNVSADEIRHEHSQMLALSARLRDGGVDAQSLLLKGDPAKCILEKSESLPADIIILGSHGHGLLRKALLGSVSEYVLHHTQRNVLIVPSAGK